jgi:hypothetical protein
MKSRISRATVAFVVLASGLLCVSAVAKKEKPPEEWDGLMKTTIKGLDLAYVRPGADMSVYHKIILDPVEVSFAKNWDPKQTGSNFDISQADRDRIKQGIADLTAKTFTEEISKDNGYPVVTEPGPDVMRLTAGILDVWINAPDTNEPGMTRTYTASAGHATLVAELRDSQTGSLFARVVDGREARNSGQFRYTNRVENSHEARMMISDWTRILRKQLDAVHAAAKVGEVAENAQ